MKIAIVVVKLLPQASDKSNAEIEKEIYEAVDGVMTGYLPYKEEISKVTVLGE